MTAGQIAIDEPAVIVHAGLPYVSDLELLDLATGKLNVKSITRAAAEVVGSRGLWAGEAFDKPLKEWRQRGVKDAWGNPALAAGIADVPINASWNAGGRAVFRPPAAGRSSGRSTRCRSPSWRRFGRWC